MSKMTNVEWQLGLLELGRVERDESGNRWAWAEPTNLHWCGVNGEVRPVSNFGPASSSLLAGRKAIAQIVRPVKKKAPTAVTWFVELADHYVTNAWNEEECRQLIDQARDMLDSRKVVLCGTYDEGSIAVLPVQSNESACIAALYRPISESVDLAADPMNPMVRRKIRAALTEEQACRDRFILDPAQNAKVMTRYALVSSDGDIVDSIEGCIFTGLVATPSEEVCARLFSRVKTEKLEVHRESQEEQAGHL